MSSYLWYLTLVFKHYSNDCPFSLRNIYIVGALLFVICSVVPVNDGNRIFWKIGWKSSNLHEMMQHLISVKIRELEKYLFVDFGKIGKEYFRINVEQETRIIWILKWDPMKRLCLEMLYSFVLWNRKTKAKHKDI